MTTDEPPGLRQLLPVQRHPAQQDLVRRCLHGADEHHRLPALVGTYYTCSGDKPWLDSIWSQYKLAMNFALSQVNSNGLLSISNDLSQDWARQRPVGENIEANAILYATLLGGAQLAEVENGAARAGA